MIHNKAKVTIETSTGTINETLSSEKGVIAYQLADKLEELKQSGTEIVSVRMSQQNSISD